MPKLELHQHLEMEKIIHKQDIVVTEVIDKDVDVQSNFQPN